MTKGIRYKNDYLNEVIFKIDFSTRDTPSRDDNRAIEQFKEEISEEFPKFYFKPNVKVEVNFMEGKSQSSFEENGLTWFFSNENDDKIVELNLEHLILAYKKGAYIGFREFLEDVSQLLSALRWYMPLQVKYLGLRYINQIHEEEINDDNIKEYINESLINNIIFELAEGENFTQLFSRLDFSTDDYQMTFQYGFFNSLFPEYNPNKDFILDLDCKLIKVGSINSQADIEVQLKKMNKIIYKKFDYAITDKLRKLMEVIE